jgi:hypothetical protein
MREIKLPEKKEALLMGIKEKRIDMRDISKEVGKSPNHLSQMLNGFAYMPLGIEEKIIKIVGGAK